MAITSKAVSNITGVRAVFAVAVAVGSERLTTVSTGEGVDGGRSPVNCFRVPVPPFLTAFAGAELNGFDAGLLVDRLAAILAEDSVRNCS